MQGEIFHSILEYKNTLKQDLSYGGEFENRKDGGETRCRHWPILLKIPKVAVRLVSIRRTNRYQQYICLQNIGKHCGRIWNLTQAHLKQKLSNKVLIQHPSNTNPGEKFEIPTLPGIGPEAAACQALTLPPCYSSGWRDNLIEVETFNEIKF